ncbi:SIR2 family NAD-dependent protein deacylase [Halobaculum sp. P14]|uniref:SIR2 family NAD-dependent protein deacylase n=1 Tax=Halobaculum sp. P14 TaxID=3421638 RepID=UPI003EBA7471
MPDRRDDRTDHGDRDGNSEADSDRDVDDALLARLAADVRDADRVVVLTGAGVSAASGVPTFRGEDGIWGDEFDPDDFRYGRFRDDPAGFWRDRLALHDRMHGDGVEPNAAHRALAALEAAGVVDAVVTQNTDGLHRAAGSDPLELHGTASRVECQRCGETADAASARARVRAAIDDDAGSAADDAATDESRCVDPECPPTCEACGGVLKPAVVLFGEPLPRAVFADARRQAAAADVFVAAGSSLTVEPAASLPAECDGTLAVVNFDETRHDGRADYVFRDDVTAVLPALAAAVLDE